MNQEKLVIFCYQNSSLMLKNLQVTTCFCLDDFHYKAKKLEIRLFPYDCHIIARKNIIISWRV